MKKIVLSVALVAATFMVVSCDFGKKGGEPATETEVVDTNKVEGDQPADSLQGDAKTEEVKSEGTTEEVKVEETTKATEKVEEVKK